ncbi:putative phage abortive infection protein [Janthinobacterium sp. MP5059B]|uniref:putative phage abortive infection protein n=1 Tax=Janthinobacterium sp. MP5059B TaxID=1766683 RepID=UPI000874655E|nr:putative phage abortive infection protein [Janthinobacterium sp. MP5059B]
MKISDQLLRHPFRYGTAAIAVLLGFFFLSFRRSDISSTVAEWGQFGDYMGGLLNPLFGLISVVLIAATLRSQTQAAKLQAFEHQFFTLLSMHASVLQSIDRQTSNKKTNVTTIRYGRDCFYLFYRNIIAISQRDRVPLTTAYQRFLKINGWEVEHYFRTVYHLFKHVKDQSPEIEATATQRKRYYDLIKSQLSQYELVLLWLNVEGLNRGNWDAILNDPEAKPFEHLNKANLVEDPPQVPSSEAADLKVM